MRLDHIFDRLLDILIVDVVCEELDDQLVVFEPYLGFVLLVTRLPIWQTTLLACFKLNRGIVMNGAGGATRDQSFSLGVGSKAVNLFAFRVEFSGNKRLLKVIFLGAQL